MSNRSSTALLILRRDDIVFERYAPDFNLQKPHYTASMAKALVGGISLMVAMTDGLMSPDDLACRYVPAWAADPLKSKITVRHLATHTAGLEDAEADDLPHEKLTGWKGDFWKRPPPPRDPFTLARDAAPVLDPPGARARYSNPGMGMLSYCVTASLRGSTNTDVRSLLRQRILEPLGVAAGEWSVGYGRTDLVDGLPLVANWGGAAYSPNAVARVGRLMLHQGDWQGRPLLSRRVVEQALRHAGLPNNMGLGWWLNQNADGSKPWPTVPGDAFWGSGAGQQILCVIPSLELIIVRNGRDLDQTISHQAGLGQYVVGPIVRAMSAAPRF